MSSYYQVPRVDVPEEMIVRPADDGESPDFWSVYERFDDGTSSWIADCVSPDYGAALIAALDQTGDAND